MLGKTLHQSALPPQEKRPLTSNKSTSIPRKEFLITNPVSSIGLAGKRQQREEQTNIFFALLTHSWNLPAHVHIVGIQAGYGNVGDQFIVLFDEPLCASTCLPIAWMLEPETIARVLVAEKLSRFESSFERMVSR